jgi:hypothetical protein
MLHAANARLDDALGLPASVVDGDRLVVGDRQVAPVVRRLGDLVRASREVAVRNRPLLERSMARGVDPVLYRAYRGVLPERSTGGLAWRADLVQYEAGVLPSGEPHRSVGHWNLPDEWEIFQVISGEVVMVAVEDRHDRPVAWRCKAGDVLVLAPRAWHLTFVPAVGSLVLNIYSLIPECTAALHDEQTKYVARTTGSPPITAAAEDGEPVLYHGAERLEPLTAATRPTTTDGVEALMATVGSRWVGACFLRGDAAAWGIWCPTT